MTKSFVAQSRRRSRELAVQLLYSLETRPGQSPDECANVFVSECGFASEENAEVREYMLFLVRGTWSRCADIDNMMRELVVGWRPERMVAVDRAILRLAVFEGFLEKKVPFAVVISEAVELAQAFGTEESGKFVNGVLAKVIRFMAARDATGGRTDDAAQDTEISTDR
ncbi:MAG: transcription antitermination factor NusB [Synergistaceae bacterium]|nr:transcription antitermination factor NusB [Synergistaceae bacterium]